ncbi:MAG: PilZ domain-containing protein [Bdellovibrionales bacterium]|nr:PilZ domain-containing protein [Bdellovibrionales bacterium]
MRVSDTFDMSQAKKFYHRSPRYTIQPKDEKFLRFVHKNEKNRSYTTQILNISATGLAFVVDQDCAPSIGDTIKVEFPVGQERIAWWAQVARLERYSRQPWWQHPIGLQQIKAEPLIEDEILVGIFFKDLPEGHSDHIRKELERKFQDMVRSERTEKIIRGFEFLSNHYWSLLLYGITAILMAGILYWLANPFS